MPVSCNRFYANLGSISITCLHVYVQLLRAQILKAQKDSQVISQKKVGQLFFDCGHVKAGRKHIDEIDP